MSDKNIHQKRNSSLPASIMTGDYFQIIRQRIMPTEIPEVQQTQYMRSHNSSNIQRKKFAYLSGRTKKLISHTNIFSQKKKPHHKHNEILGYKI